MPSNGNLGQKLGTPLDVVFRAAVVVVQVVGGGGGFGGGGREVQADAMDEVAVGFCEVLLGGQLVILDELV